MTQAKKLKRKIRARARKTGERYSAARRHVLAARDRPPAKTTPATPRAAKGGGLSDAAARTRTGRSLESWFTVLDAFGAVQKGHTAAARHLSDDHGVDGWYAQGITVAYERASGLRTTNQRMNGSFEVSVSKTLDAPMEDVAEAIRRAERRAAWLQETPVLGRGLAAALSGPQAREVKVRTGKDAHLRYAPDGLTIEIRVMVKPGGRSSFVATTMKLKSAQAMEAYRSAWRRAFESLKNHLAR